VPTSLPTVCECVLRFDHLNIEDGLSQSSVGTIFQDSRGFMWFGTQDGLNRYDGYGFKIYKPDLNVPGSLSDRWITTIIEDAEGFLWIGTRQGGLNRFDPRAEAFIQFTHNISNPASLSDNHVNTLLLDTEGNLWVGTENGLDRFDRARNTFQHFLTGISQFEVSKPLRVLALHQDSRGKFWVGTGSDGLVLLDPQTRQSEIFPSVAEHPGTISNNQVNAIVEDTQEYILWVGTRNGLNRFDPNTGRFTRFQRLESTDDDNPVPEVNPADNPKNADNLYQSLSSNSINTLFFDSAGNLWVGTADGLNRYQPGKGFAQYQNDLSFTKSLSENNIISLYEDHSGILWIGTQGGGVNIYNHQKDVFAYFRHKPQDANTLNANAINTIYVDSNGYAWIGTNNGLNHFNWGTNHVTRYQRNRKNENSLGSNEVTSIYEDQNNVLWIGTSNGLDRFDRAASEFTHFKSDPVNPDSLSSNFIYIVYVDSHNTVWVGTSAGLDRFDREKAKFIHYTPRANDSTTLSGGAIRSILEDDQGYIWVGTLESGLNRLDPVTGIFTRYRFEPENKSGINNDSIMSIYQDGKGRIWIGTAGGGLNLYLPATNSFVHYLEKDGLPSSVVNGILEDASGNLWLGTSFGISRFTPETKIFRNFDAGDGLQGNEFNPGAYARGRNDELYFGGGNGLTVFRPADVVDNSYAPQVALTSLTQDDKPIITTSSVETLQAITLEYPLNSFEFNFTALSYNQSVKNRYAYFLEGFDTNWHYIGTKRDGRYTNIPGGEYTLLLKTANSDGIWNENPTRIKVTVIPPYWQTNWFRAVIFFAAVALLASAIRLRTKTIQDRNRALEKLVQERTYALEDRNREIEALYKADERILRNVSMNQVFQMLVDVAVDMLHADRSAVFTWDEKKSRIVPRVSYGFSSETLKLLEFAKEEGLIGQVFITGKPVIVSDLAPIVLRYDVRTALKAEGIRSFVHLPIMVDQKVVGVLNLSFTREITTLADDSVRLLSALINRASISIANMQLFEQTKELAVMEERNRLARDLHDSAKQKAFAALAQLGTARGILNGNGERVSLHLNEAENLVSDVIQELTFLIQEIYPMALQAKGLALTLREYIFEWENRTDANVNFIVRNDRRLPLEIEQAMYRVTQEALANVARHSQARQVDISLIYQDDSIQLSLSDDGQGFDINTQSHGMGLRSIRERVGSVRGTLQIQSAPGRGTRLIVQVPAKS